MIGSDILLVVSNILFLAVFIEYLVFLLFQQIVFRIYKFVARYLFGTTSVPKDPVYYYFSIFYRIGYKILGIEYVVSKDIVAQINNESTLVLHTHASLHDSFIILIHLPHNVRFLAKAELFKIPVVKQILRVGRVIPINRTNLTEAIKTLDQTSVYLKKNYSLVVAPEGTRRRKASITEQDQSPDFKFKKGPFHLAKQNDTSILPIICYGYKRLSILGGLLMRPGTVYIDVLDKISSADVKRISGPGELHEHVVSIFNKKFSPHPDSQVMNDSKRNYWYLLGALFLQVITYKILRCVLIK